MYCRYVGSGLKGPVSSWGRQNIHIDSNGNHEWRGINDSSLEFKKYMSEQPWSAQLEAIGVQHVAFALGFKRDFLSATKAGLPPIHITEGVIGSISTALDEFQSYHPRSGAIGPLPGLYGAGIAFPHNVVDTAGLDEPWVGFAFGMKNTQSIVDDWYTRKLT